MADNNNVKDKFRRSLTRGPRPTAEQTKGSAGTQFSLILSSEEVATFDRLAMTIRQKTQRPVKKSDIVRVLVELAADDPTLSGQVIEELQARQS